ncbi:hypothetical protein [Tumebacillus permanentifrigoris]|uniref:DUF4367 domain-containing protein n=1 Tax=Tumebacillus permanentifrigoris TaxID=378543 RepID=A0A316D483_9BACL|nr:hypothetical protein [Tumebacillus permanentifrigoris]PWK04988.1 hypothetical protein C7459_1302 [Tumebacillus permanentifrigoris]
MKKKLVSSMIAMIVVAVSIAGYSAYASTRASVTTQKSAEKVNHLLVSKDRKEVESLNDKAALGLSIINENVSFHVKVPEKLKTDQLHASMMMKPKEKDDNSQNVDLSYDTPQGRFHIWETNLKSEIGKDPLLDQTQKQNKVVIDNHDWFYMIHESGAHIFNSRFDDVTISVDGTLPYDEMVRVIESLN